VVRQLARGLGLLSIIWFLAAMSTAAFVPRGPGVDAQDRLVMLSASLGSSVLILLAAVAASGALVYLLLHSLTGPLLLSCAGLIALALLLPAGLTPYFLPPPIGLLASAWLLTAFPDAHPPTGR